MLSPKIESQKTIEGILSRYASLKCTAFESEPLMAQIIDTPLSPVIAVADEEHLLMLAFIDAKRLDAEIKDLTSRSSKYIVEGISKPIQMIKTELDMYFRGELMEFKTPIKLERGDTEFRLAVWKQIHAIPFGQTKSYAELAKAVGNPNGYRAVANACGRNQLVIIVPCHRVVGSNGTMGGFSSGIDRKEWLLKHEKKLYEY